jgi:hypothetical protein
VEDREENEAVTAADEAIVLVSGQPSSTGFLPSQPARATAESVLVRVIATAGVIGIGTAVGAILSAQDVAGWIAALVVATLSVVLAAILWRSRRL